MSEKKVILFIVEGPSDEAALGTIMEEYFNNEDIKFLVVHGDITIKNFITKDNAIIKINEQIGEKLKELSSTLGPVDIKIEKSGEACCIRIYNLDPIESPIRYV